MIDLLRNVKIIRGQIELCARCAISGCRAEDSASIAAMTEIAAALRAAADAIDRERVRRECCARDRAERNLMLWGR